MLANSPSIALARPTIHTFRNEVSLMRNNRFSRNEVLSFIHTVLANIERRENAQSYMQFLDSSESFVISLDRIGIGSRLRGVVDIRNESSFIRWYNGFIDEYREIILTPERIDIDFLQNGTYRVSLLLTFQGRGPNGFISHRFRQTWVLAAGAHEAPVIRSITSRSSPTRTVTIPSE